MTDASRTVRSAVGIGAITALSRVVGFVRVLVVAAILGATYLGNLYHEYLATARPRRQAFLERVVGVTHRTTPASPGPAFSCPASTASIRS